MGVHARGIGSRNRWPCVGEPASWPAAGNWFNCAAEGSISLIAAVPEACIRDRVLDGEDQGAIVHLTVCSSHVKAARAWLRERVIPGEDVDTFGTEFVLRTWGQLEEIAADTPIFRAAGAAS